MKQPERGKSLLYLSRQDVIAVGVSSKEVRELVRTSLIEHAHRRCEIPPKIGIHPVDGSLMHAMPAWLPANRACGMKWIECFPSNQTLGLPQTSGLLILNCPETGWPLCVLDATWITAMRTPAVSALACQHLARKDATVAAVIGTGAQGREHVRALVDVLPELKVIKVAARNTVNTSKVVRELQLELPDVELVTCATVEDAVRDSLVVVTATVICSKPQLGVRDDWIPDGALVLPLEFDSFIDGRTFERAHKFVVDSRDDFRHLHSVGRLSALPEVSSELGQVIAGLKAGREDDSELIVDMNFGIAIEDVAVGWRVFQQALRTGIGSVLSV